MGTFINMHTLCVFQGPSDKVFKSWFPSCVQRLGLGPACTRKDWFYITHVIIFCGLSQRKWFVPAVHVSGGQTGFSISSILPDPLFSSTLKKFSVILGWFFNHQKTLISPLFSADLSPVALGQLISSQKSFDPSGSRGEGKYWIFRNAWIIVSNLEFYLMHSGMLVCVCLRSFLVFSSGTITVGSVV